MSYVLEASEFGEVEKIASVAVYRFAAINRTPRVREKKLFLRFLSSLTVQTKTNGRVSELISCLLVLYDEAKLCTQFLRQQQTPLCTTPLVS